MTAGSLASARSDRLAGPAGVKVISGIERLSAHRGEIEALAQRCGAAVTARTSWILASVSGGPRPWAVLVRDPGGFLRAAAILVETAGRSGVNDVVTLAGTDLAHRGALLADDGIWSRRLGIALAHGLPARTRGWAVDLGPLDADSPALDGLLAGFPQLVCSPTDPIPLVRRELGLDAAADYLAPAMRRTLHKAANRLATDGTTLELRFTRSYTEICELLPALATCRRDRDHDRGRVSDLDDERGLELWLGRLRELAADGLLEVSLAYLDGKLAAHVVGIRDGETYRVLEGHLVTKWSRYAPGRLLETAVLQRMLDDPAMTSLDWMTSVAPDSLLATNGSTPMVALRAGLASIPLQAG
jgi:CelD/BcsL family acetyltransferase involved in cellulose biosynthesis